MAAAGRLLAYYGRLLSTPSVSVGLLALIDSSSSAAAVFRLLKALLRLFDARSDLQRVLAREVRRGNGFVDEHGVWRGAVSSACLMAAERAIMQSALLRTEQLALVADAATGVNDARDLALDIARVKGIDASLPTFAVLVRVVESLRELFAEQGRLLDRTTQRCDAREEQTERQLRELWSLLKPDVELFSLVTKQWQDVGFQGNSPETDFRSTGLLGLDALRSFARSDPPDAQRLVRESVDAGAAWYPLALASISVCDHVIGLAKTGALHPVAFAMSPDPDDATGFFRAHDLYLRLFHAHWRFIHSPPFIGPGVMAFESEFKAFRAETERWARRGVVGGWLDERGFVHIPLAAAERPAYADDGDGKSIRSTTALLDS